MAALGSARSARTIAGTDTYSQPLKSVEELTLLGERRPRREAVGRKRTVRSHDLPDVGRQQLAGALRLAVELDGVLRPQSVCGDLAEHGTDANVEVQCLDPRELDVPLGIERRRLLRLGFAHRGERRVERRRRPTPPQCARNAEERKHDHAQEHEQVDVDDRAPHARGEEERNPGTDADQRARDEREAQDPPHAVPLSSSRIDRNAASARSRISPPTVCWLNFAYSKRSVSSRTASGATWSCTRTRRRYSYGASAGRRPWPCLRRIPSIRAYAAITARRGSVSPRRSSIVSRTTRARTASSSSVCNSASGSFSRGRARVAK